MITTACISLWEMKIYVHTNTCTLKFIEALFIIVKNLKSPTEKWIRILWYIPEMFLSNKKNKLLRYNVYIIWLHDLDESLKSIMLSERGTKDSRIHSYKVLENVLQSSKADQWLPEPGDENRYWLQRAQVNILRYGKYWLCLYHCTYLPKFMTEFYTLIKPTVNQSINNHKLDHIIPRLKTL